jgi:glutaredoxin/glutathione-dependent peroxiredoxin
MPIAIGTPLPDAILYESTKFGEACPLSPEPVKVGDAVKGKRIVIFGLPGAYTPTCSGQHVPGYVAQRAALAAKGVDEVWCVAVNDGFVMAAWGQQLHALEKVRMLGDGSGEFAKKLGLDVDLSQWGMGQRMARFSMLVENGVVTKLNVEQPGAFAVSDATTMLGQV